MKNAPDPKKTTERKGWSTLFPSTLKKVFYSRTDKVLLSSQPVPMRKRQKKEKKVGHHFFVRLLVPFSSSTHPFPIWFLFCHPEPKKKRKRNRRETKQERKRNPKRRKNKRKKEDAREKKKKARKKKEKERQKKEKRTTTPDLSLLFFLSSPFAFFYYCQTQIRKNPFLFLFFRHPTEK